MPSATHSKTPRIGRPEIVIITLLTVICLVFALYGRDRRIRRAVQMFIQNAPRVQLALEAYAHDHQGRFPPDAMHNQRPLGLSDKYIEWNRAWNIDYDTRPNPRGGSFICLEWCGPNPEPVYHGLCNQPEYRRKYPHGEPIPLHQNRIWLVRESAPIMPPPPPPPDGINP